MEFFVPKIDNRKKRIQKIAVISVILCGIVLAAAFLNSQIKNFFYVSSQPIRNYFLSAGLSASNQIGFLFNFSKIRGENEELKEKNYELLTKISLLLENREESSAMSEVFSVCREKKFTVVLAKMSGYDNQDMISIDRGTEDGIEEGMPVINQHNILFGKIYKVYKNFAQVMLISNKNSVVNVQIQQQNSEDPVVNGSVKGEGDLSAILDIVPIDSLISSGQTLTVSALDQTFPKDILIGEISEVFKNDQKPFQQAKINLFFDLKKAENLFVITNYKKN
jgi:rod shape-determining protein MreC